MELRANHIASHESPSSYMSHTGFVLATGIAVSHHQWLNIPGSIPPVASSGSGYPVRRVKFIQIIQDNVINDLHLTFTFGSNILIQI